MIYSVMNTVLDLSQSWHVDHGWRWNIPTIFDGKPNVRPTCITLEAHLG